MDQLVGCSVEEARATMRTAARLHARFWRSAEVGEGGLASELVPRTGKRYIDVSVKNYGASVDAWNEGMKERGWHHPEAEETMRLYIEHMHEFFDKSKAVQEPMRGEFPATLVHGDLRADNVSELRAHGFL